MRKFEIFTPMHRIALKKLIKESGVNFSEFLNERSDLPDGFNYSIARNWLYAGVKSAYPPHYNYLIDRLVEFAHSQGSDLSRFSFHSINTVDLATEADDSDLVKLDAEMRKTLQWFRRQSKITPRQLLEGRSDIPHGLTSATIYRWLKRGVVIWVDKNHLHYAMELWQEFIEKNSLNSPSSF